MSWHILSFNLLTLNPLSKCSMTARTFSPIAIETEKPLGCYRMGEETEKKES
jgi:hypothetical protein